MWKLTIAKIIEFLQWRGCINGNYMWLKRIYSKNILLNISLRPNELQSSLFLPRDTTCIK